MDPTLVVLSFIIFTMVEKYHPAIFTNDHVLVGYAQGAAGFVCDTHVKSFHRMPLPKISKKWYGIKVEPHPNMLRLFHSKFTNQIIYASVNQLIKILRTQIQIKNKEKMLSQPCFQGSELLAL